MKKVISDIVEIRDRYRREADLVSCLFGCRNREDLIRGKRSVVVYGAGAAGREMFFQLELSGCRPICFCDSDPARAGSSYCDVPVIGSEELVKRHPSDIVLVAAMGHTEEIRCHLREIGFPANQVFSISRNPRLHRLYVENGMRYLDHIHSGNSLIDLGRDEQEIHDAYNLLCDKKSRDLFVKRIALLLAGASYAAFSEFLCEFSEPIRQGLVPQIGGESFAYFKNDIIALKQNEVLVDGGAYDGDSANAFIETCKARGLKYGKVFCFEPEPVNFQRLKTNTAPFPDVICYPYGLSDCVATRSFLSEGMGSRLKDVGGTIQVETTTIDHCLSGERISLIKLDVEGAEMATLRGAETTIKEQRPALIVSAYHRNVDIFKLVLRIHELVSDYKIYVRHCGHSLYDTVIIAVA